MLVENPTGAAIITTISSTLGAETLAASNTGNRVAGVSRFSKIAGQATDALQVSVVDTATHQKLGAFRFPPVAVPGYFPALSIALNRDGSLGFMVEPVLVNEERLLRVSTLQLPTGAVQTSFTVSATGFTLAIAPDDSRLYLDGVCAVTLDSHTLQCTPAFNGNPQTTASGGPAVVSLDGAGIYHSFLMNANNQYRLVIDETDSATMKLSRDLVVPLSAAGDISGCVVPALSSSSLYLACSAGFFGKTYSGALLRIDLADFTLGAVQFLNYVPLGIAATPDGAQVLVTGSTHGTQVFDGATLAYTNSIGGGIDSGIVIAPR